MILDALERGQSSVLVVSPHPDDAAIAMGGTIKRLVDAGSKVTVVVVTNGERGSPAAMKDHSVREQLARKRESEEAACALLLGYESIQLGLHSAEDMRRVAGLLSEYVSAAHIIFTPHRLDGHQTHTKVTLALLSLEPSAEIWGFEVWHPINAPDLTVDISPNIQTKISAIMCHKSQVEHRDFAGAAKGLAHYRGVLSEDPLEYAECFKKISNGSLKGQPQ